jgi:hypothetical protein
MTVKPDKAITLVRSTHSFSILPMSILIRDRYNPNGVKQRWLYYKLQDPECQFLLEL